jgi:CubicO group peptidase (beta-lactamase class C family)
MPHKKFQSSLLLILAMFLLAAGPPPAEYTAQLDDTLPRLAEKYYRTPQAWPALLDVPSGADSPPPLRPGQRLTLPAEADPTAAPPPAIAPVGPACLADFSGYVADARQHFAIPGAALAVIKDGQIVLAQGYGVRELGRPEPVTPETLFGIGSTTKAMSSMLVASLVDEGRGRWDEPVREIWPGFTLSEPIVIDKITLRHLLSMSSGLPRADLVWSGSGMTAEQIMASLADLPVLAPPGERFEYNNQAYATGIYAATLAAGGQPGQLESDYARQLQQRVFDPSACRGPRSTWRRCRPRPTTPPRTISRWGMALAPPIFTPIPASLPPERSTPACGIWPASCKPS